MKELIATIPQISIPNRQSEEYKYSNVGHLLNGDYAHYIETKDYIESKPSLSEGADIGNNLNTVQLVFVNGVYQPLSSDPLPAGVHLSTWDKALVEHPEQVKIYQERQTKKSTDVFHSLNSIYAPETYFLAIDAGTIVTQVIQLLHVYDPIGQQVKAVFVQPRLILSLADNASVTLMSSLAIQRTHTTLESTALLRKVAVNRLVEILVASNANLQWIESQYTPSTLTEYSFVNTIDVFQQRHSTFRMVTLTANLQWVRNNLSVYHKDKNCESYLFGLFLSHSDQHVDNHTLVDHLQPLCQSHQLYKGILTGKSTGVFNGKVYVHRDAQKINAFQSSKNILLSDDVTINAKPQLEIYADDVKCSHGSSTGRLDPEQMFYLRSRGLSEASANTILLVAFAAEVLQSISDLTIRSHFEEIIENSLNGKS